VFDLKNMYSADIISSSTQSDVTDKKDIRANIFQVSISGWIKKEEAKGARTYLFAVPHKSDLYSWVIYLNFLRVKAIYDNFTLQFGQINLPLSHEGILANSKVLKNKFNPRDVKYNLSVSGNTVTNHAQSVYLRQYRPEKVKQDSTKMISNDKNKDIESNPKISKRGSVMLNLIDHSV